MNEFIDPRIQNLALGMLLKIIWVILFVILFIWMKAEYLFISFISVSLFVRARLSKTLNFKVMFSRIWVEFKLAWYSFGVCLQVIFYDKSLLYLRSRSHLFVFAQLRKAISFFNFLKVANVNGLVDLETSRSQTSPHIHHFEEGTSWIVNSPWLLLLERD